MAFDLKARIATHASFFHVTDTVSVVPKNPAGETMAGLVGHKGAVDQERLTLIGGTLGLEQATAIWEVWNAPRPIRNGFFIVASDGTEHVILGTRFDNATSRWECATVEA